MRERKTDRYGLRPEYRIDNQIRPRFDISSRVSLDLDAVSVFVRLGYYIGNSTPLTDVRYAGPEPWITPPQSISRDAAIDRYGELMAAAVRSRAIGGPIMLPLSGGQDSRHILFELLEAGKRPVTITMPQWVPRSNEDMPIARRLAKEFGLRHVRLRGDLCRVVAEQRKNRLTDFLTDEHAWMLPMRRYVRGRQGVIFDGLAGDILSAGLLLREPLLRAFEIGNLDVIADMLLGPEEPWRRILSTSFYRNVVRDRAVAFLKPEIARHLDAPNPVSSFFFWNRTRREVALFGYRLLGNVQTPYLDAAVYDHLTSLPASMFLDRQFHRETINRRFPEHAHIPFDTKRGSRLRWWLYRASNIGAELHRLARRSEWVRGSLLLRNWPPDYVARAIVLMQIEALRAG